MSPDIPVNRTLPLEHKVLSPNFYNKTTSVIMQLLKEIRTENMRSPIANSIITLLEVNTLSLKEGIEILSLYHIHHFLTSLALTDKYTLWVFS